MLLYFSDPIQLVFHGLLLRIATPVSVGRFLAGIDPKVVPIGGLAFQGRRQHRVGRGSGRVDEGLLKTDHGVGESDYNGNDDDHAGADQKVQDPQGGLGTQSEMVFIM